MVLQRLFKRKPQNPHQIDIPVSTIEPILNLIKHLAEDDIRAEIKKLSEIIVRDHIFNEGRNLEDVALCPRLDAVAKLIRDIDTGRAPHDTAHDFKMRVVNPRSFLLHLRLQ